MPRRDDARDAEQAVAALRRVFDGWRDSPPAVVEGLRDRKKRELRQRISDVATAMFVERGFDNVRVAEIAAAVDVSEKTVFNYFPTKESLVFDREELQTARMVEAVRDPTPGRSLVQSIVEMIEADVHEIFRVWRRENDAVTALGGVRQFAEMIEDSPGLTAGLYGMQERMTMAVAEVLAERVGIDPEDPEPQAAAVIVLSLWRAQLRAMVRHADGTRDFDAARDGVIAEVRRAAAVAEGGLAAFELVVRPASGKEGLVRAAKAADASSRRVVAAVKEARDAWKQVAAEVKAQKQGWAGMDHREAHAARRAARDDIRQLKRDIRQLADPEARRAAATAAGEARRAAVAAKAEARRAAADARRRGR
jgi:AcrR family transcriptional regulator